MEVWLMVNGAHMIIYSEDAAKARTFFKDILGLASVDAGRGWLIFALPPAEIAAHPIEPGDESGRCELYLMCDDIKQTMDELSRKGVEFSRPLSDQPWGIITYLRIPGAGEVGLYQPRHPKPPH
jgi:predicted enzyme related to lactoylglutathione lyase